MYIFEINVSYNHIKQTLSYWGNIVQQNKLQVVRLFWVSEFRYLGPEKTSYHVRKIIQVFNDNCKRY